MWQKSSVIKVEDKKKPIFILGVGAQKAGTSWLHSYLKSLPEVDMGFMKEYHVFDQGIVKDRTPRRRKRILEWLGSFGPASEKNLRAKFRRSKGIYFRYFTKLVHQSPKITITGDITPSYSALPAEKLREIKLNLEQRGFRVVVFFLMRDPVERCISSNRMNARGKIKSTPESPELEAQILERQYKSSAYQLRTRYDITIKNLEQVFSRKDIFYGFYEELFTPDTVQRVCGFLDLPFREAKYEEIVNGAKVRNPIPDQLRAEIRSFYSPVYSHVARQFGADRISKLWRSF